MAEVVSRPPWPQAHTVLRLDELTAVAPEDIAALERRPWLSVGALDGDARGLVMLAALAVDLLVVAPRARLGDGGEYAAMVLRRARGITGLRVATYLAGTARLVDAERAAAWGLVTAVDADPVAAAVSIAEAVAARSPVAVATILRLGRRGSSRDWLDSRVVGVR